MTKREIMELVEGNVICIEESLSTSVGFSFATDLMSDVPAIEEENQRFRIII